MQWRQSPILEQFYSTSRRKAERNSMRPSKLTEAIKAIYSCCIFNYAPLRASGWGPLPCLSASTDGAPASVMSMHLGTAPLLLLRSRRLGLHSHFSMPRAVLVGARRRTPAAPGKGLTSQTVSNRHDYKYPCRFPKPRVRQRLHYIAHIVGQSPDRARPERLHLLGHLLWPASAIGCSRSLPGYAFLLDLFSQGGSTSDRG